MVSKALAKSMNTPIVICPSSVYFVIWFSRFIRESFVLYPCLNPYWWLYIVFHSFPKNLQCDYSLAFQITYLLPAKLRLAYNFLVCRVLLSPFLNIGTTLAILSLSEKIPVERDKLIINAKGSLTNSFASTNILTGKSWHPLALDGSRVYHFVYIWTYYWLEKERFLLRRA